MTDHKCNAQITIFFCYIFFQILCLTVQNLPNSVATDLLSKLATFWIITSAKEVMFSPDFVCLFVCLCVSKITQKVRTFWNFLGMSRMAKTTSDSILGVIWKESWILDHFEIFVNIAFNGA